MDVNSSIDSIFLWLKNSGVEDVGEVEMRRYGDRNRKFTSLLCSRLVYIQV